MKHQLLIVSVILLVIFTTSCRKDADFEVKRVPIIESLKVEHFAFEGQVDSERRNLLQNVVIINSIEQLTYPFEIWDLETPNDLKQFDYEKYTLLLRFNVDLGIRKDIEHLVTRNYKTGIYTYMIIFNANEAYHEDDRANHSEIFFFHTGILIDKIAEDSKIEAIQGISWR